MSFPHPWQLMPEVASVFLTMTIVLTTPQILAGFRSSSSFDKDLLVTIWELGEGIGPLFIASLSEKFGQLAVFRIGNFLALCCLGGYALSVNIPMLITFRFLTGCFLSILTLGPAIVGDLFDMDQTGLSMALVIGTQMIADFISPIAGSYIAEDLGWRWAIWLAVIVLGFFSLSLASVLKETYAVVILRCKAKRLQNSSMGGTTYRSKHQARVDAISVLESILKPLHILTQSPILILTTSYVATIYAVVPLIITTLTEAMQSTYPTIFSVGSIGLTFVSLAIGNTIALTFYCLTSDHYVARQRNEKGDDFKPESRLVHLPFAAFILPIGFLLYGWTLAGRSPYIAPLIGIGAAGFGMLLATIAAETYVVDVYEIHGAPAIAAGVIFRATAVAFLPLIGPPLYQSIGYGWGNTVLAAIAAVVIPSLVLLVTSGDWFRSKGVSKTQRRRSFALIYGPIKVNGHSQLFERIDEDPSDKGSFLDRE
jgi:MFS family permease